MLELLDKIDRRQAYLERHLPETTHAPTNAPKPKILFSSYVSQIKHISLDVWQLDLCARLEKTFWLSRASLFEFKTVNIGAGKPYVVAPSGFKIDLEEFEQKKGKGTRAAIHAPPQFGKSILISQAYPAWIFGYDPTHRFRLATYNKTHSRRFSGAIRRILASPEHKSIFTDPRSFVPTRAAAEEWSTAGRLACGDGQPSFIALGLESGFVGTGFETLLMDDPYASVEKALSEVTRETTWRFYSDTAHPRAEEHSNEFIMFHRYHQDDQGGRAIATGKFELWRYAAQADGDYVDEETGLIFADPFGRKEGEYLSPRRSLAYYAEQRENEQVWNSQFQGRPTSKTGSMFNISMLQEIEAENVPEILYSVRAWDNAATEDGGAWTVGTKKGIDSAGNIYIFDMERDQVNTAEREALQFRTAERDGRLVAIHAPQDPGSAGKDTAYKFRQMLRDYQVFTEPVTGTKTQRAYAYSVDFNKGKVFLVKNRGGSAPAWFKPFKEEHRNFPLSTNKDIVDAGSDGHKYLTDLFYRGLVIKGYDSRIHLVGQKIFQAKCGDRIPKHWEVSAAVRISSDASKPSGWAIIARAAENAYIGEAVILVASARRYVNDATTILAELKVALMRYCEKGVDQAVNVWLSRESANVSSVAAEKLDLMLDLFEQDSGAGIPETNWYMRRVEAQHPFNNGIGASRLYIIVADEQIGLPKDEDGQVSVRQEIVSWAYNDREEPQEYGGIILDCVRMMLYNFSLTATELTRNEALNMKLPPHLREEAVVAAVGTPKLMEIQTAHMHAINHAKVQEEREGREQEREVGRFRGQPVQNKRYRGGR